MMWWKTKLERVKTKSSVETGGLFNLAVRLMQLFSSSDQNFTELTRWHWHTTEACVDLEIIVQAAWALLPDQR